MLVEVVWAGNDNTIRLLLTTDGVAQSLAGVTRMTLTVTPTDSSTTIIVDSDDTPDAFDWTGPTTGLLVLALGQVADLETGRAVLRVYDAVNVNGIAWEEFLIVVNT